MLLDTVKEYRNYYRTRNNKKEQCMVGYNVYYLRCDNCGFEFTRNSKVFNKRSSAHVCSNCNQKSFAQSQSTTWRKYNKLDASAGFKI